MLGERGSNMCIAVFTNRTNTLMFYAQFQSFGVDCKVINMPSQLGSSCTICIQFKQSDLRKVRHIINQINARCLVNIYKIAFVGNCRKYVVVV